MTANGSNGVGLIDRPGLPCDEGGEGASWHYDYSAPLASGVFSQLTGDVRLHLDLHSEAAGAPVAGYTNGWLPPGESHAALGNQRGVVRLALASGAGSCDSPNLGFNGKTTTGSGTWSVEGGTGSYRDTTGTGSWTLNADVAPGADNPFQLTLNGALTVLQPNIQVEVVGTYWGFLGVHYLNRIVSVIYKVTNTGPGDAFDVRVNTFTSPTPGVTPLGPMPQRLGDLLSGDSEIVRARYQFELLEPCNAVILGCEFDSTLNGQFNDALDVTASWSRTTHARAPDFPPPAS